LVRGFLAGMVLGDDERVSGKPCRLFSSALTPAAHGPTGLSAAWRDGARLATRGPSRGRFEKSELFHGSLPTDHSLVSGPGSALLWIGS
jgi:hypothetical protein